MSSFRFPQIRYADADGLSIAYEVRGSGPPTLVRIPGSTSGVLTTYLDPIAADHCDRLASFSRYIALDRRGTGLSDPLLDGAVTQLEQRVADVVAVMDAVDSQRCALYGQADGGQVALLFAAMYPDRVDGLILSNAWARYIRSDDYPYGLDPTLVEEATAEVATKWGDVDDPWGFDTLAPSRLTEPGYRELLARVEQVSASRATAAAEIVNFMDVRDVLHLVQAPTLILFVPGAPFDAALHAEFLFEHLPNARLAPLPGTDYYFGDNTRERAAHIEEFLTGTRPVPPSDRVLATVLFTDIVASTERLAAIGDARWREQLDRHDSLVRAQLDRFRGREISTAGDSFFATFDGPARAIRCAQAVIDEVRSLGLDLRAGVHTGECEVREDGFGGIAVHIGARVSTLAGAGQVLTTSTVKDLVAGSGITFSDYGSHTLKGVPEPWHLYEVV